MPKYKVEERDLKTVRESELTISRRFRRELDGLDYKELSDDLRQMFRAGLRKGKFSVFYFVFAFKIEDVDTDDLPLDIQRYVLESLRKRFKGRFDAVESSPESDISNWRVFTSAFKARSEELENFLASLPAFFDKEILSKFNVEVDHTIYLISASCVFKRMRRTKKARKGIRKKRTRSRVRLTVYQLKGKKRKPIKKRKAAKRVKRSRKVTAKKRKRIKKSRRL